jgi:1-phosphofructokinase family hexose kinase
LLLTVTPNAALDKLYILEQFAVGRVHRPTDVRVFAGGKGINVARAARTLGADALATGFLGGHTGDELRERLAREGIPEAFQRIEGETRLCLAAIDTTARTQTEINEPGPFVTEDEQRAFRERFSSLLDMADTVAFCGSLPTGVAPDFFRRLLAEANRKGVRTVVDTSGESLELALEERPTIVKPNAAEASALLGREIETVGDAAGAARDFLARGVSIVAVTLGRCGAVLADSSGAWYAQPPEVEFVSAVGSGDSFVAGLLVALDGGGSPADALRYATAAGAANATMVGAGCLERHLVENLAPRVTVTPL